MDIYTKSKKAHVATCSHTSGPFVDIFLSAVITFGFCVYGSNLFNKPICKRNPAARLHSSFFSHPTPFREEVKITGALEMLIGFWLVRNKGLARRQLEHFTQLSSSPALSSSQWTSMNQARVRATTAAGLWVQLMINLDQRVLILLVKC